MAGMTDSRLQVSITDKRKALSNKADAHNHYKTNVAPFTCNAAGTTTTLVGANAAPGTNDNNVVRRGEKFKIYATAGDALPKEETIFTVTGVAVAASTTVTFTPAAAQATANNNVAKWVDSDPLADEASLDAALTAINGTTYSATKLASMTQNDKIWAYRQAVEADSF